MNRNYTVWDTQNGKDLRDRGSAPRGIKVDFYTRDVGGIPVPWILKNAVQLRLGEKEIRVICLEGLILAKHRAGRTTDVADLRQLMIHRGGTIVWDLMVKVACCNLSVDNPKVGLRMGF